MRTADELAEELRETRRRLEAVTAQVARNEEKMRQTQRRELRLLQAPDLAALFREMIAGLRESYRLQYVSVVLQDSSHDIRHLLKAADASADRFPGLLLVETLTGLAPQYVALRKPWLGPYAAADHQLIFPDAGTIASVAMIPLTYRGNLIGSINFGSDDPGRFTREHASDFLAHLGVIASFCIENVVNRARLLRSGYTDVLTGWHNRRYLQLRLREELARARRDGSNVVCLMLDIDHFKRVNDTWGHAAGDTVLQELAQRIESQVRASDVAARYGGEEFVVLLPNTDSDSGVRLAERIRTAVAAKPVDVPGGGSVDITASIGIAEVSPGTDDDDLKTLADSLVARADVALYNAKRAGRDRVAVEAAA